MAILMMMMMTVKVRNINIGQVARLWQRDRARSAILRGWVTLRLNF